MLFIYEFLIFVFVREYLLLARFINNLFAEILHRNLFLLYFLFYYRSQTTIKHKQRIILSQKIIIF